MGIQAHCLMTFPMLLSNCCFSCERINDRPFFLLVAAIGLVKHSIVIELNASNKKVLQSSIPYIEIYLTFSLSFYTVVIMSYN